MKFLTLGCAIVMALHVAAVVGRSVIRPEGGALVDVIALLDANQERTLAAWWTAGLLISAALAAAVVARLAAQAPGRPREAVCWAILAVIFAMLSLDEIVSLHERGATWTASVVDSGSSTARLGWMIPAAAVIVLSLMVLIPVFRTLSRRPMAVIVTGLGISVAGALGMEYVNVLLVDARAELRWRHIVMAAEEGAEMAGVVIILAGISMALRITHVNGAVTLSYLGDIAERQPRQVSGTR